MKRILLTGVIAAALFASSAFAASFDVNTNPIWDGQADISSGSDSVEACADEVGVDLTYDESSIHGQDDWDVDKVRVRLAAHLADCDGHKVQAALQLKDGSYVLTNIAPVGPSPTTINLTPNDTVAVGDVVGVNVIFDAPPTTF